MKGGDNMAKKINEALVNGYIETHPNTLEAEIAEQLGISPSTVSRIYHKNHNKRRPRATGH